MKRFDSFPRMLLGLVAALAVILTGMPRTKAAEPAPSGVEFFEKKIRPVLVEHCYKCHSAESKKAKGGLRLDSAEAALKGGDSGPAIVAGKPEVSLIIEALRYRNEAVRMPPKGRLPERVIADFEAWIAMGAPESRVAGRGATSKGSDLAAARKHWAFQPIASPKLPALKDAAWPRTT